MVTRVYSGGVHGVEGYIVNVEADISDGMPFFELGGNLGSEVKETRERVRAALRNTGFSLPVKRITVNLSPADRRKYGTLYDFPVAVSILRTMNVFGDGMLKDSFFAGELMLSGELRPVKGILPMVLKAKGAGLRRCLVPRENVREAALVDGIEAIGIADLNEAIDFIRGEKNIPPALPAMDMNALEKNEYDMGDVSGQLVAKRGLEIAASGYHNVLMVGPPGSGKSMLAKCIPSIMPKLTHSERLEISTIYSVGGMLDGEGLIKHRPFVSPHHTCTDISLIGGGARPRPGAVSLASGGVLFMDEFPEFSRNSLEVLRQPLEDGRVRLARNLDMIEYPADFMLVAAMNPCPCGAYPNLGECTCTQAARIKYRSKISKPILDRIDICLDVNKVSVKDLISKTKAESSAQIRERVLKAQKIQNDRFDGSSIHFNSQMNNQDIEKYCNLNPPEKSLVGKLIDRQGVSARSYYRILKLARTIADLDGAEMIREEHIYEAFRLKCSINISEEV